MLLFGNFHPITFLIIIIVVGLGMSVHEFAHNYVGWKMGDPVPKAQKRLTLNPLVHINWVGFLMFVFIGFGPLGSAPISPQRMRDPRWGYLAAVAAGPFSNLALAIVSAIFLRIFNWSILGITAFRAPELITNLEALLAAFLFSMVFWNVLLFVFNLIPLFPIDGWSIVLTLLPGTWLTRMQIPVFIQQNMRPLAEFLARPAFKWRDWQQLSYYAFMILILLSFAPLPPQLDPLNIFIFTPAMSLMGTLIF